MTSCQPLPQSVAEEMLQVVARAICDRPGDSSAQRESRTRQLVHSTLGFEPRDGLEYMLSTMLIGHFHLILDSMSDVFQGQVDSMKARTKTTIVALDRSMLAFVKELRVTRKRPLAGWVEDARRQAEASLPPDRVPGEVPASETEAAPVAEVSMAAAAQVGSSEAEPALSVSHQAGAVTPVKVSPRPVASVEVASAVDAAEAGLEKHLAEFQETLAAMAEMLALDGVNAETRVAGGD